MLARLRVVGRERDRMSCLGVAATDRTPVVPATEARGPSMKNRLARGWHLSVAVLVALAIVVQLWIAVRVSATPPAHAVGTLRGTPMANRVLRVLSFFTVQSNILSGVTSAQLARTPNRDGGGWRAARLAALFGITVTGIVYGTVLSKVT